MYISHVCNCMWKWAACHVLEVGCVVDKSFWPLHLDVFAKFSVSCDYMRELIQSDSLQSCHARIKVMYISSMFVHSLFKVAIRCASFGDEVWLKYTLG